MRSRSGMPGIPRKCTARCSISRSAIPPIRTTGTHVVQICMFLMTEARFFPGRLVQTSPPRSPGTGTPGSYPLIDLDLSRYDQIAQRFSREQIEGVAFLKSGIATRNADFNAVIDEIERVAVRSRAPMLLMGPTGAGKSFLSRRPVCPHQPLDLRAAEPARPRRRHRTESRLPAPAVGRRAWPDGAFQSRGASPLHAFRALAGCALERELPRSLGLGDENGDTCAIGSDHGGDRRLFDALQLEAVIRVCRRSKSLSDAGRALYGVSREAKSKPNDADRLKKYLARFDLDWDQVAALAS